jgi:hypothetical protein
MSTPTTMQSSAVPMAISVDSGVTWKNVLCKRAANFNGTTSVNAEETDCGIEKGLGTPDWTMDFEGVVNMTPDGATEMSWPSMGSLWQNKTLVMIRLQNGTFYIAGSAYITDLAVQEQTGNLVAFTFTANGVGTVDFTA